MEDNRGTLPAKDPIHPAAPDISLIEARRLVDVSAFASREVVDHGHVMTFLQQSIHEMRADESRTTRH
jgi:hypothetical protein